jgi:hypothetical protein
MRRINDVFAYQDLPTRLIFAIHWIWSACPVGEINHGQQGKQESYKHKTVPHVRVLIILTRQVSIPNPRSEKAIQKIVPN